MFGMANALESMERLTLTADEVAAWLNVPAGTVSHLARVRVLPSIQIGKHQRFRPSDIVKYVTSQPLKE